MTKKELILIIRFANQYHLPLNHRRIAYAKHIVRIGRHDYLDASKARDRLDRIRSLQITQNNVV